MTKAAGLVSKIFSAVLLSACGVSTSSSDGWEETRRNSARIIIDGININWGQATKMPKHSSGHPMTFFTFTKEENAAVKAAGLSINQRVALAKRAVDVHPNCAWVGFDPAYNQAQSRSLGRADDILVAPVSC